MKVENAVYPDKEQIAGFLEPGQLNIETVDGVGACLEQDGFARAEHV